MRTLSGSVNEYIAGFPASTQVVLKKIRAIIRKAAPQAEEMISYGIAGYKYKGMLIYFAGFNNHVSVYPAPRSATPFKKELAGYGGGKGTVQFPLDQPIPEDLISRIIKFRLKENEVKFELKNKKPIKPGPEKTAKKK